MTQSKLSRWFKRGALAMVACAAIVMVSADQAKAQFYGGRGISINSGLRGFNLNIGNGINGFSYGRGLGYRRGFSTYGGLNSGYAIVPQRSFYRGGGGFYGSGLSYPASRFPYQSPYYGRRGY